MNTPIPTALSVDGANRRRGLRSSLRSGLPTGDSIPWTKGVTKKISDGLEKQDPQGNKLAELLDAASQ